MMRESFFGITEQRKVAKHRFEDAKALVAAGRWRGAMYLAGYSVECLLKTKLMQKFACRHLKDLETELQQRGIMASDATVFTHQLESLLRLTSALDRLRQQAELMRLFAVVNRWVPAWRYNPNPADSDSAKGFLDAVEKLSHWIEHNI